MRIDARSDGQSALNAPCGAFQDARAFFCTWCWPCKNVSDLRVLQDFFAPYLHLTKVFNNKNFFSQSMHCNDQLQFLHCTDTRPVPVHVWPQQPAIPGKPLHCLRCLHLKLPLPGGRKHFRKNSLWVGSFYFIWALKEEEECYEGECEPKRMTELTEGTCGR